MFYRALTDEQTLRVRRARPVHRAGGRGLRDRRDRRRQRAGPRRPTRSPSASSRRGRAATTRRCTRDDRRRLRGDRSTPTSSPPPTTKPCARRPPPACARPASRAATPAASVTRAGARAHAPVRHARAERARARSSSGAEGGEAIAWSRSLAFPGLRAGRDAQPPHDAARGAATLLARDGSVLAEGEATQAGPRSSPLGESAGAVVGEVGPIPSSRRVALEAEGVPSDADRRHERPGARARRSACAARPAASCWPGSECSHRRCRTPRTPCARAISPAVQRAAVQALGSQLGGVVALRAERADPRRRRHRPRTACSRRARRSRWSR